MTAEASSAGDALEYRPRLVVDALRHRMTVLLMAGLVGMILGYAGSVVRTGAYVSTASVLITPLPGNPYSPGVSGLDTLVSLETEAQVASSDSISALVSQSLGGDPKPSAMQRNVTVAVPPNTQIIQISYSSADAVLARDIAQAFARSYLDYRAQRAESIRTSQMSALTRQEMSLREQLADARKQLAQARAGGTGSAPDVDYYTALRSSLSSKLVALQGQRNALSSNKPQPGHVISPATVPTDRSGFGQTLYLAGGLVLGLLAGSMVGLARQRRDERIHHLDEVESAGFPVLAAFSRGRRDRGRAAEAVRKLRIRVLSLSRTPTIVVVGPAGEGGRVDDGGVAMLLAESLTNVGRKVVMVDLVGERALGQDVHDSSDPGITDLLMDASPEPGSLLREIAPGLSVLPKGRADLVEASEFLDGDRMLQVITEIGGRPDYLVLRSPALSESVGQTLMSIADATIVTVTLGRSTHPEIAAVRSEGERTGSLLGCVVTPATRRRRVVKRRRRSARAARTDESIVHVGADVRV